jgi:glycosyltransferase involved in cell wall biosynthesis
MEGKLRVLLLASRRPPLGGAEEHLATVEALLAADGHAVEALVPEEAAGWRDLRDRFSNPAADALLRERLAAFRPDVVHVHNFLRRLGAAPFAIARAAGVPALLTVHDFQLFCPRTWAIRADGSPCAAPSLPVCLLGACRGGLEGLRGRATYAANALRVRAAAAAVRRHATRILAPSEALASRLRATLRPDVVTLPHPFPDLPGPCAPPPNGDLLFLGRVAPEKGILELLRALAAAAREGTRIPLTVAGDGPALEEARALAAATLPAGAVRFEGRVGRDRVPVLLAEHGALVLPSVWMENAPVSVAEALAAGRPVLGSVRGGIPETVRDGVEGFLFDPLDPAALGAALRRWAALPGEGRALLGASARRRAESAGGPPRWREGLLEQYHAAIRSGPGAPR